MMEFRERHRPSAGLEMTPLIDMVFLLLVFFLLTANFMVPLNLRVDLPELVQGTAEKGGRLDLLVDRTGRVYLNGDEVDPEGLAGRLRRAMAAEGTKEVVVRGDDQAPFGVAVHVLESVSESGADALFVAGERKPGRVGGGK